MKITFIRSQLESHLNTWASKQTPIPPIAWQNVPFNPPKGVWLQATLIPADTVSGDFCSSEYKGLFRINVFGSTGQGSNAVESIAQSIAAYFEAGTNLSGVKIPRPPSIGQGQPEEEYYMVPISIRYRFN